MQQNVSLFFAVKIKFEKLRSTGMQTSLYEKYKDMQKNIKVFQTT